MVLTAADTDQLIYLIVIRFDVSVFERPGDSVSVVDFEIEIGVPQADTPPDIGLSTMPPDAIKCVALPCGNKERLLSRTQEKLGWTFTARDFFASLIREECHPKCVRIKSFARIEHEHIDSPPGQIPSRHST